MTDRVRTLTVVLKDEWRIDDVEPIVRAIKMLEPVADVVVAEAVGWEHRQALREARTALAKQLYAMLMGDEPKGATR